MKIHGKYMTRKDIEVLKANMAEELGISMATNAQDILLALSIAILADVFGFGEVRINRFTNAYNDLCESMGVGTDSIDTIKANIEDVYGDVFRKQTTD